MKTSVEIKENKKNSKMFEMASRYFELKEKLEELEAEQIKIRDYFMNKMDSAEADSFNLADSILITKVEGSLRTSYDISKMVEENPKLKSIVNDYSKITKVKDSLRFKKIEKKV